MSFSPPEYIKSCIDTKRLLLRNTSQEASWQFHCQEISSHHNIKLFYCCVYVSTAQNCDLVLSFFSSLQTDVAQTRAGMLKVCALTFLVVGGVWDWEKQQRESIERKGTAAFGRQAKAKALKQYNVRVCAHTHTHSLSQNTLVSLVSLSLSTDINSLKVAFILIWLAQSIRTLGNTSSSDNY